MSYILDALKRADAERGLTSGAVTADTQPHAHGFRPPAPWWRSGTWVLALAAALLGLAGLTALWWPTAKVPDPVESAQVVSAPVNTAPAPTPVPASRPEPTAEVTAVPVAPVAPLVPPIAPDASRAEPMPELAAASSAAPPEALISGTEPSMESPAPILLPARPVIARPVVAANSKFGPDPVPAMPAAVARPPEPGPTPPPARVVAAPIATGAPASAPPVKVTGATYSDNPAHRMLIVNGKIVLEGQQIEPGLTLEVITPHSAVLNHQGSRFNINY